MKMIVVAMMMMVGCVTMPIQPEKIQFKLTGAELEIKKPKGWNTYYAIPRVEFSKPAQSVNIQIFDKPELDAEVFADEKWDCIACIPSKPSQQKFNGTSGVVYVEGKIYWFRVYALDSETKEEFTSAWFAFAINEGVVDLLK